MGITLQTIPGLANDVVVGPSHADAEPALLEAVAALRARICPSRPVYHAFEWRDHRIVYDLLSGTLLEPDVAAFELLRGLEEGLPDADVIERMRAAAPAADARAIVDECARLAEAGLFQLEPLDTPIERERTVAAHMRHHPNKMMLLVQTSCNLKCTYCYEVKAGFHSTGKSMDYETGVAAIEHMIRRSGNRPEVEITFFGGEPLINFGLVRELVAYCKTREPELGKQFHYQMTTNAVLMTDEVIDYLIEHRFGVMISIDGPPETADLHRRDLGGRGQTAKAVANAQRLIARQKQAGIRTAMIRATMAPGNSDALAIHEYFRDAGFERTMIGGSSGRAYQKGPGDLTEAHRPALQAGFDTQIDQYLAWVDGKGPRPAGDTIPKVVARLEDALQQPKLRASVGCGVARNTQAITEDGSIYPCHRYAGDKQWVIGNLKTGLDPARTENYYREILSNYDKHCSHCVARFTCGGQCPWYLSLPDGSVGLPDEPSCDSIRLGMEKQIGILLELRSRRARGNQAAQLAAAEPKGIDE
jgi:uncharacterized protein